MGVENNKWREMAVIARKLKDTRVLSEKVAREKQSVEQPAKDQAQLERALELLDMIDARPALQAFCDKNWQEGEIQEGTFMGQKGIQLISAPYLKPVVDTNDQGVCVFTRKEFTTITMVVSTEGDPVVSDIRTNDLYAIPILASLLSSFIREHGLSSGLNIAFNSNLYSLAGEHACIIINPEGDNTEAQHSLYELLVDIADFQKRQRCLPTQARKYYAGLIEKLPVTLQEKGQVGGYELRHWAREVTGSKLGLFLDRHLSPNRNPLDRWERHQALRH